ncbi:MAG: hypothetical protein IPK15_18690 [Verrucomicrobia bacterium]|nr:hypothetical protein [Verrucomicrobiota bacterium]
MKTMLCLLIAAATTGLQLKSSAAPVQLENSGEHFRGMADASAGVMLGTNFLAVGNDEDNQIRIYRLDSPDASALRGLLRLPACLWKELGK